MGSDTTSVNRQPQHWLIQVIAISKEKVWMIMVQRKTSAVPRVFASYGKWWYLWVPHPPLKLKGSSSHPKGPNPTLQTFESEQGKAQDEEFGSYTLTLKKFNIDTKNEGLFLMYLVSNMASLDIHVSFRGCIDSIAPP